MFRRDWRILAPLLHYDTDDDSDKEYERKQEDEKAFADNRHRDILLDELGPVSYREG
jgi:hypothetical protein